jgi:hypothetical protein
LCRQYVGKSIAAPAWSRNYSDDRIWRLGRHVADQLRHAANGGDVNDAVIALRFVLQLENVPCQ